MNIIEKKRELKKILYDTLLSIIDNDYILLSLPYHYNIGDTLIYEGEKDLLRHIPYRCLYETSTFNFDNRCISPDTIIVFHGGGNFGDVYRDEALFKNKIVKQYNKNKIVFLPQTVHYNDLNNLHIDSILFSNNSKIVLCARDSQSYKILYENFSNNEILLLPDMAFCIDDDKLCSKGVGKGILFLQRTDGELKSDSIELLRNIEGADVRDWPTYDKCQGYYSLSKLRYVIGGICSFGGKKFKEYMVRMYMDFVWKKYLLPFNVKTGIKFIDKYNRIYTTRLHGAILAILLNKEVYLCDNTYGKNYAFYKTWLYDVDNISLC